ncbi:MAG: carbohydrate-binding protein [Oscillospiraceae bacterium]|nr:carbohydrate-binding protein [Oscillospiraceae bacterium]
MKKAKFLAIILSLVFLASMAVIPVSAASDPFDTLADAAGGNNILMFPTFVDGGDGWADDEGAAGIVDYYQADVLGADLLNTDLALDKDLKYGSPNLPYWVQWMYEKPYTVNRIILRTANDSDQYPRRMGDGWTFSGSTDGKNWNVIYTGKQDDVLNTAYTFYYIDLPNNTTPYQYYQLDAETIGSETDADGNVTDDGGIQLCDIVLTVDKSVDVPTTAPYVYVAKNLSIGGGSTTIEGTDFDSGASNYGVAGQAGSAHDVRPDESVATQWCGDTYIGRDGVDGTKIGTIGWITAGDWVQYTVNVVSDGTYDVSAWIGSGTDPAGSVNIYYDGNLIGNGVSTNVDWQTYADVPIGSVAMTAGSHVIKVEYPDGNINFQSMDFVKEAAVTTEAPATVAADTTAADNAAAISGDTTATTASSDNGNSNTTTIVIIIIVVVVVIVIVIIIILATRKKPDDKKPADKK